MNRTDFENLFYGQGKFRLGITYLFFEVLIALVYLVTFLQREFSQTYSGIIIRRHSVPMFTQIVLKLMSRIASIYYIPPVSFYYFYPKNLTFIDISLDNILQLLLLVVCNPPSFCHSCKHEHENHNFCWSVLPIHV